MEIIENFLFSNDDGQRRSNSIGKEKNGEEAKSRKQATVYRTANREQKVIDKPIDNKIQRRKAAQSIDR